MSVHTCGICGFSWLSGINGSHDCAQNLALQIRAAAASLAGWVIWESIQCFDGHPDRFGVQAYIDADPDNRDVIEFSQAKG